MSCTQTAIVRNMTYAQAFEIVQNQEWENEDDFGDELLDLIRRHKRVSKITKVTLFRVLLFFSIISQKNGLWALMQKKISN